MSNFNEIAKRMLYKGAFFVHYFFDLNRTASSKSLEKALTEKIVIICAQRD